MLLRALELAVVGVLLFGFITELLIPWFMGIPVFPSFRKKRNRLQEELKDAKEEVEISEIKSQIVAAETEAEKIERETKKTTRSKK